MICRSSSMTFSMLSGMLILFLEQGLVKIKLTKLNQNLD